MSDSLPDLSLKGFVQTQSNVPGIIVFAPAPEKERLEEVVRFSCPQCGGQTAYSVENGGLTCTYCGYHEAPQQEVIGLRAESFEFTVDTVERAVNGWGELRKDMVCDACGAQISLPEGALAATCPFCASNKVIHHRAAQDVLRPRFLVPFQVEERECLKQVKEWLGSSWMVPRDLRRMAVVSDFVPMFLPYWTFSAQADATWKAQVGRTETTRRAGKTHRRTVWRWENGQVSRRFSNLLVRGTGHVSSHLLGEIGDFNLDDLVPYDASYLAGMQAQAYEIGMEAAWQKARQEMREETKKKCREGASTNKIRNFSMHLDFADESWRYILLPVYINSYRFQNKPFQLLINGQTGKLAGQRPADWRKIALVSAGLMLPGVLLFLILLFFFPQAYGEGGGFWSFLIFLGGMLISIAIAYQASKLDEI